MTDQERKKKENNKKAVEYLQRLLHGKIPDFEANYSFSNKGEKSGSNLL